MKTRKRESFLSRKRVLSDEEYEEYKRLKSSLKKESYKEELEDIKKEERDQRYRKTKSGKVGGIISGAFSSLSGGVKSKLYKSKSSSGKVGRPKGTVKYTDPRTGQPIGVYEYRKILSARLRKERMESERRNSLSPQEATAIRRVRMRNYAQSLNPERKTIPDTYGDVNINGIMDEINRSSNLVR